MGPALDLRRFVFKIVAGRWTGKRGQTLSRDALRTGSRIAARLTRALATKNSAPSVFALSAVLALAPAASSAETLLDAIQMAYQTNPTLRSQQAKLRATDEGVAQAKAGYGPQINFNGQVNNETAHVNLPPGPFLPASSANYSATTGSASIAGTQPLFTSGSVHAQVQAAKAEVGAGRQDLRSAESQLILNVVTAYEDVRRDRQTLAILREEISDIENEYQETKARTDLGDLTMTDLSQAEARLVAARSQLTLAMGQLDISNAEFANVVGENPGELEPEPALPGVPASSDQAFDIANQDNPQLLSAIETEHAAAARVRQAKASFGPTVSLQANAGISPYETFTQGSYITGATVGIVVTQPIFTSGLNTSKVHEAMDYDNSAEFDVDTSRRTVVQQIAHAWDQMSAAQSAADLEQKETELQTTAVKGYQVESKVGMRSTIDLLNAELELANDRIGLLQSQHDAYVARAALLAAMGHLEIRYLVPAAPRYDPGAAAKQVESRPNVPWVPGADVIDSILYPPVSPTPLPADLPPTPPPARPEVVSATAGAAQ